MDNVHHLDTSRIAEEVAEAEFNRFTDAMDLDVDMRGLDDEDKAAFNSARRRFIRAVQSGSLVVNDNGEPVFTPVMESDPKAITFHEPDGKTLTAMDGIKEGHTMRKFSMVIARMSGENMQRFDRMKQRDRKVVEAIGALFLG